MQVGHADLKFKKMGLIGTLKIVSCLGDANNVLSQSVSQVERHIVTITNYTYFGTMCYYDHVANGGPTSNQQTT